MIKRMLSAEIQVDVLTIYRCLLFYTISGPSVKGGYGVGPGDVVWFLADHLVLTCFT